MEQQTESRRGRILLAGRESFIRDELAAKLEAAGFDVLSAGTGAEALRALSASEIDVVLAEWDLPDLAEGVLARRMRRRGSTIPFLIFGRHLTSERRRELSREGIEDYLELPVELSHAPARVQAALARGRREEGDLLLGNSEPIRRVIATIAEIAPYKVSVLVTGESGTGKELVARSIHLKSPRRDGPFVAVNCGALPPGVLESELFGHEKGAFTGAVGERKGRFELADGGTLFLDEVGELPPTAQVELLRVLEEERFLRVGGTREVQVDVRIVAATNRDLEIAVTDATFRQDLYHRLRVVSIRLPALRERAEDIPVLVAHFTRAAAERHGLPIPRVSDDTIEALSRAPWPGNIRELRNIVDSMVIMAKGREITAADLPAEASGAATPNLPMHLRVTREDAEKEILYQSLLALRAEISEIKHLILRQSAQGAASGTGAAGGLSNDAPRPLWEAPPAGSPIPAPPPSMAEMEEEAVRRALSFTRGNRREAARLLGIGLRTLYRKIRLYGLG